MKELREKAGNLARKSQKRRRREVEYDTGSPLSEQSPPNGLSFLEDISGDVGVERLYSIDTFQSLCLWSRASRLSKTCLTRSFFSEESCSRREVGLKSKKCFVLIRLSFF